LKNYLYAFLILWLLVLSCDNSEFEESLEITIPVNVMEIKPGAIKEFVTATADVFAMKKVALLSQAQGYYRVAQNPQTGMPYKPGDKVKAGNTIIFLDNPELENNTAFESKKLNLDISQREYEKQKSLYEKGGVTLRELKNAESMFIEARYAYDNAGIQLAKLKVSSSFDGIITSIPYYTRGVLVSAGQLMANVMDYSTVYSDVSLPAKELGQIKTRQQVIVTQYNIPGDSLMGVVDQVDLALDIQNRSFNAHIIIDNPGNILRPGMYVKLDIVVASKDSSIVIPKDIILSKRRGKTVFVVEKNAAEERVIATGLENEKTVEVLNGVKNGERIVIKGFETLRDHSKVKIVR
jgi:RND family efflux transporter MFP subunit